ncbi:MAG: prephenate dehydrogenase [Cytophagales bacterium]|jgi:prephenate dehydrogenase|nr:prephenate dehydrogenase [Cytophagales bacterium]MCA6387654.1 prephenate dehydrogenase [Cytophagales bacterium]MCA6392117.1 prephenate dehydrogenase [Cytophagales bacterium]MCA6393816.1 prephenate dehydrogenase [Cytophagales bacterium]MCA6399678.1 prephenate dehydrogenase [Cytophagales bacterium]
MKIAIVGLGLIGGSLAIDLRSKKIATRLIGIDFNEGHARKALELGLVDEILTEERAFAESDVVILAIPVNTIGALLPSILDRIAKNTVVIDTGSTKTMICKSVTQHNRRTQFVAAHPISGTENSGPTAALKGLFEGKTNIICEKEQSSDSSLAVAKMIFDSVGMNTIFMEPDEHDKHVAYVSHLSHVSSFLLGQTVLDIEKDEKNIFDLAGSGFASTVRLAKSSPAMWAPIFEQNSEYLSQALLEYIMHLQKFHYHLMKKDTKELVKTLTKANEIRRVLDKK